jgi:ferritin-like metal-binding protein YciE
VRAKRHAIHTKLDQQRTRLLELSPGSRRDRPQGRTVAMLAIPALAGAGLWAWRRSRGSVHSLGELLLRELAELHGAEIEIGRALESLAEAATSPELRAAFQSHRQETEEHVERLNRVFRVLRQKPSIRRCRAVEGIVKDAGLLKRAVGDGEARDAALVAVAQKLEHYEIAVYGTVHTYARMLRCSNAARLLQQTLDEEHTADEKLTQIAVRFVNREAV